MVPSCWQTDPSLETRLFCTCSVQILWLKSWLSQRYCRQLLRSESTSSIQDLPPQQLWDSLACYILHLKSLCWWMLILLNTSRSLLLNTTTTLKVLGRSITYRRWDEVLQRDWAVILWPTHSMSMGPSSPSPKAGPRRALMTCWWQCTALWRHSGKCISVIYYLLMKRNDSPRF